MKKITLLFLTFLAFNLSNAQDTCASAVTITAGSYTVAAVNGTELPVPDCAPNAGADPREAGEWYIYTASLDGIANITTDLPANTGGDTRLHIYTGTCGSLTCWSGSDDVSGTNYLTDLTFPITNGTNYYVAWDNQWDSNGFDFILTETAVSCSTASPYSYDFVDINPLIACYEVEDANADGISWGYNNGNDLDGDTVNDPFVTIFPQAANTLKNDWLYLPVFNGVANAEYSLTIVYNAFNNPAPAASESFDIVVLDSPSSTAGTQSVIGTYTGITQSGAIGDTGGNDLITQAYSSTASYTPTANGDFYFAIHATSPAANSGILLVLNLSASETLGVNDFETNSFTHFYNKDTNVLTLNSSSLAFDTISIFNILGQQVLNRNLTQTIETLDLSVIKDGVYLAKVTIEGRTQTIKLLKQ